MRKRTKEENSVKFYTSPTLFVNNLSTTSVAVLFYLLKRMSDAGDTNGGQMVYLNHCLKLKICDKIGVKNRTLSKALSDLCDNKVMRKIAMDTYQVNPFLFGKGSWDDIRGVRLDFIQAGVWE